MYLINFCVVSFQQIKREKAMKDELVRELESKELEMQLLLQRQISVSPRTFSLESYWFPITSRKISFSSYSSQGRDFRTTLVTHLSILEGGCGEEKNLG